MLSSFRDWRPRSSDASRSTDLSRSEPGKMRVGTTRTFWNKSGSALDDDGESKSWLRHAREKSLSDGVQFMSNITLSGSNSPTTGSARLSPAAAQQLGTADEDEPQCDLSGVSYSMSPLDRPIHRRRGRHRLGKSISDNVALMRAMNSSDLFGLDSDISNQHEKSVTATEKLEKQVDVNQSLDNVGSDKCAETGDRRSSMIAETKPKMYSQQSDSSLGRQERIDRKQRRRLMKTQSEGVAFMRTSLSDELKRPPLDTSTKLATLSELAQMSTKVCCLLACLQSL